MEREVETSVWNDTETRQPSPYDLEYKEWKHLIPCKRASSDAKVLPMLSSGPLNYAVVHWANGLVWKAFRKGLTQDDLYDMPRVYCADVNSKKFGEVWEKEIATYGTEKASVTRAVLKMIKYRLLVSLFLTFMFTALDIMGPAVFILNILRSLDNAEKMRPIVINAVLLAVCIFIRTTLMNAAWIINVTSGVMVKGGVLSYLYQQVLKKQIPGQTVGQLVNLCANDGQRLFDACMLGTFSFAGIVAMAGAVYIIIILGPWGILGFAIFFAFLPIQTLFSNIIFKLRSKAVPITDERVRLMTEVINAIKLVKMYAWEKPFASKIHGIRKKEKKNLARSLVVQSISNGCASLVPLAASALTFVAMTLTGQDLTTTKAFLFISVLNALKFTIGVMPFSNKALAEAKNACDRMKSLLLTVDLSGNLRDPYIITRKAVNLIRKKILVVEETRAEIDAITDSSNVIEIRNGSFGWASEPDNKESKKKEVGTNATTSTSGKMKENLKSNQELEPLNVDDQDEANSKSTDITVTLKDINVSVKSGSLVGVCGGVGSGKTSLIYAILNDLIQKVKGDLAVDKSKKIAYVPQQAWIMNTTVRENILFGQPFDGAKYDKVVEACSLESDFLQLSDGDKTEIGERGINLSGGQKQRISIARAVYSDADIILLDDPLSAVDAHVGQQIFEKCIRDLIKSKTVVFVTHQLQFLRDCDYILVMKDGRINEEGTHDNLMAESESEYSKLIKSFHESEENVIDESIDIKSVMDEAISRQHSKTGRITRLQSTQSDRGPGRSKPILSQSTHNMNLTTDFQLDDQFRGRASTAHSAYKRPLVTAQSVSTSPSTRVLNASTIDLVGGSLADLVPNNDGDEILGEIIEEQERVDDEKGKLLGNRKIRADSVSGMTYWRYVMAAGGPHMVFLAVFAVFIYVASGAFCNYWLSHWINNGSGINITELNASRNQAGEMNSNSLLLNPKLGMFRLVYSMGLVAALLLLFVKSFAFMTAALRASSSLHDQLFRKVVASPMRFFDVTPCGQVLNRFSRDLDEADVMLPVLMEFSAISSSQVLVSIGIVSIVFTDFLIALVPIIIVFAFLYILCREAIKCTKKIENSTRSPLYSHVVTSVQGLTTIRAYKETGHFLLVFNQLNDSTNMAMLLFNATMRWASVRLDCISLIVVSVTAFLVAFVPPETMKPAFAGLALAYALNVTGAFQLTVRLTIDSQARFLSVERITDYIKTLDAEAPAIIESHRPDNDWPKYGGITFTDVKMRYRDGLPLVLKGISLDVKPEEKLGIVGRTGSGKSSIAIALFRITELASGCIKIDNLDISTIGLEDLRSKLSIIPQDPVLFIGTVRYNLDPFNQYNDDELWEALSKCHIKPAIMSLPEQLNTSIVENGENFSVGERQLLCMARALLRHCKILVLDEATAAIDTQTDSLIQETIKEAFTDCTMLTIAHRLNTVMSSDKILVLDDGRVVEYGSPRSLLADKESVFAQMVEIQESQKKSAITGTS